MATIATALQAVHARIALAARAARRDVRTVKLLAVSKTWPADAIRAAYDAGQRAFGESYVREALQKINALHDLAIEWHFIGPIQSNKTRPVAEAFAWVHSVDRLKIAQRLADARPNELAPLNICLQVNISGEASKGGVDPAEAIPLAHALATLPRLRLRGLMAIPEPSENYALQRSRFSQLRVLLERMNQEGLQLDTLSMGMSHDLEAAIEEGATIVRVGSAIFGTRTDKTN
jgi:pyridoxal phosphate enzyme (YggS family)